jgi:hypothetical protein
VIAVAMHRPALTLVLATLLACNDGGDGTGSTDSTTGPRATDSASDTSDGTTTPTSAPTSEAVTTGDGTGAVTTTTDPGTTGAPDTSSNGDTTSSGSTTGEARGLKISLADVAIVVDCQPIIADDPLQASWTVVYDNSDGQTDASAELDSVFFIIAEGDPPTAQPFTVEPTTSGTVPAGQVVMQKAMKITGPPFRLRILRRERHPHRQLPGRR